MDFEEWEGIARAALETAGLDAAVDAVELAEAQGVEVFEYPGRTPFADLMRRCIYIPQRPVRRTRWMGHVAHELAHILLADHGHDAQNEDAARYLAGALLVPRETLDRDLRSGWSVRALRERHPNASHEMLARRIAQVRPAIATILDRGKVTARVPSPWLAGREVARTLREWERELAERAMADGEAQLAGPTVATRAGAERVVVVSRQWWASSA